ncbi:MAG: glycosyltransferase [Acidimicrobiales bacterium]|jgi:glycosyltransferase involved in cell wall biosynthesis
MLAVIVAFVALLLISLAFTAHTVQKYKQGVVFRLGRFVGERSPGLVMVPIQSQGLITRDNLSVDVSAVSYYRVVEAAKSVIRVENIKERLNEITQTTLRQVVGQHTFDDMVAETSKINVDIKQMLEPQTADWGVLVTLVGLKDIRLPDTMSERRHAKPKQSARSRQGSSVTSAWPRHGGTSSAAPEASTPPAFSSSSKPSVATMMMPTPTVALVSTYPPTVCGLATFTSNLSVAIAAPESGWSAVVVRIMDRAEADAHEEVVAQWITGDRASLHRAVAAIESSDAVVLQHEYGLFGGPDGEDVLELIEVVRVPLVAVLHTVLPDPTPRQRHILEQVMAGASLTVVQSEAARRRLIAVYGADTEQVVVVPHGAAANFTGPVLTDIERPAVLTWGLVGPGKGIEHGISAVALLQQRSPAPVYIVAGQTHPKVLAAQGEHYRHQLQDQSRALGIADRVRFDGSYRDWESLRALVRSVDVVLLPYDSRDQVSSGVLVEAIASGKPVVATRFPHAEELLSHGAGLTVPQGDFRAMADALDRVLYEPGLAARMATASRREGAALFWPTVGATYRSLITEVLPARAVA